MRIQFHKRVHLQHSRLSGGALKSMAKHVSNVNKLAQDFSRIYMTPKVKAQKKFVLKL